MARSRSTYYRRSSYGREKALQHIEEAKALTRELGGTDQDVKAYFFSLPGGELAKVLTLYERDYGTKAREYAVRALPRWRSGSTQMSGMVATRLFNLLPPLMPLEKKYELTENLWRHLGPTSKRRLRIGREASLDDVLAATKQHIDAVVSDFKIPADLERRFNWLTGGDVELKQKILNRLQNAEKALVMEGAQVQLPVMLEHMRSPDSQHTHRMAQILKVGKHELELLLDKEAEGVSLEAYVPVDTARPSGGVPSWVWWVVGIGGFLWLLSQ